MKRTTYIMIGALVAGFLCVTAFCAYILSHRVELRQIDLGGEPAQIELPAFANLEVDTRIKGRVTYMGDLKGVAVEERDSLAAPYLLTIDAHKECIKPVMNGDTLNLIVNFNAIADTINSANVINFSDEGSWLVKVVVPKGSLRSIKNYWHSLSLKDFDAKALSIKTDNRLNLTSCRIDSLYCRSRIERLKFDKSSVGYMLMTSAPYDGKIDCCDGSGEIGRLEIKAHNSCDMDLSKANVRSLVWIPEKESAQLHIRNNGPYEINLPSGSSM